MRAAPLVLVLATAALAGGTAAGCGSGGGHRQAAPRAEGGEASEAEREAGERERAARTINARDRVAYYQLATGSGLLRAAALSPSGRRDAALDTARVRLTRLRPRERRLAVLRDRLVAAAAALSAAPRNRAVAERAVRASDAVNAGLARFVRAHPAAAALLPD